MIESTCASTVNKLNISVVASIETFVKDKLSGEGTGHDWWHIARVRALALKIAQQEQADMFIVEAAALLHDVADWKFYNGDENVGPNIARELLTTLAVEQDKIEHVCSIVKNLSFKGAGVKNTISSIEGQIVQDADRLDALGAIGIARCFAYGGYKQQPLHDPEIKPRMHTSFEEYKTSRTTSINHFYEKLLLLKDLMNTQAAKRIAQERHEYLQSFLAQFLSEWNAV